MKRALLSPALLSLAPAVAAAFALAAPGFGFAGYAPPHDTILVHTARPDTAELASRSSRVALGEIVPGFLSSWGLPPVPGQITLTDTGLVFQSSNGSASTHASAVSLAYVDDNDGRAHYLFRVDAGVFETDAPGPLLQVAAHRVPTDSVKPAVRADQRWVNPADSAAHWRTTRGIATGPYADSLYSLFGRPRAAVGLIGRRGRIAGRLGEYIVARDSLAFDPARMTGEAQLRHALAHELGHRWQARAKVQITALWSGVRAIRDPKRYGYGDLSEHQAEAVAFAINFLQTTAGATDARVSSLTLLDHYELLVPGTRTLVRYLSLQPTYRNHPLRSLLTAGRITYALEK